jgi:hypothetical protein
MTAMPPKLLAASSVGGFLLQKHSTPIQQPLMGGHLRITDELGEVVGDNRAGDFVGA